MPVFPIVLKVSKNNIPDFLYLVQFCEKKTVLTVKVVWQQTLSFNGIAK